MGNLIAMVISDKEIEIHIGEIEWCNQMYSGTLPNNFEAQMRIFVNNVLCFDESVSVGELLLQLRDWTKKANSDVMNEFNFFSIDTEDNPIFSINHDISENKWILEMNSSVYQSCILDNDSALSLLRKLLFILDAELQRKFGNIKISW